MCDNLRVCVRESGWEDAVEERSTIDRHEDSCGSVAGSTAAAVSAIARGPRATGSRVGVGAEHRCAAALDIEQSGGGQGLGLSRFGRRLGVGDEGHGPARVVEQLAQDWVLLELGEVLGELGERGGVGGSLARLALTFKVPQG